MKSMMTSKLRASRRKPIASDADLVTIEPLMGEHALPVQVRANINNLKLAEWSGSHTKQIETLLLEHRALLFRNFDVTEVADFEKFVKATSQGEALEYRDRTTPRTNEGQRIYTSTIYPSDQSINLHNEGTYWINWARKIYFCCLVAAPLGGETPLADVRKVHDRIDEDIRATFSTKQWALVRNFNDGFGLTWQDVFQTPNKKEVESYCRANNIEFRWKDGDRLRTRQVRPAIRKHPQTGENVWFNHATFYHSSMLDPQLRKALVDEFGEQGLPYGTTYGDGTPIEDDVAQHVRDAYEREKIMFPWRKSDVLLLDNMSVAHAREPFSGERRILVSMTEAVHESECET